jgi:hypothetical protein
MLQQMGELVEHSCFVGKDTVLHVDETCTLECRRLFGNEASLAAWNFEMLAENIFRHGSASWYKPGGINGARIGLAVYHPTNMGTSDVSVVRTLQDRVIVSKDSWILRLQG